MQWLTNSLKYIWILTCVSFGWEYWALNHGFLQFSILHFISKKTHLFGPDKINTELGWPISYWLGIIGLFIMILTNLYVLRKRISFMQKWGTIAGWLEVHVFFGLMGPTFILFHSNFKVGGIAAVSFWSMMIVAGSGFFGRYIYLQVLEEGAEIQNEVAKWERAIERMILKSGKEITPEKLAIYKKIALDHVGAYEGLEDGRLLALIPSVIQSVIGDIRLLMYSPRAFNFIHPQAADVFCSYALSVRKEMYTRPFKKLLGYWYAFHVPFTVMMFITALIHVVVVTALGR